MHWWDDWHLIQPNNKIAGIRLLFIAWTLKLRCHSHTFSRALSNKIETNEARVIQFD